MFIDAHAHVFDRGYLPKVHHKLIAFQWGCHRAWSSQRGPYRDPSIIEDRVIEGIIDPEAKYMLADMDRAGIQISMVYPLDYGVGMGEEQAVPIEEVHRHYGELQRANPDRLVFFAGPDPRRTGSLEIFKRAIDEHGLKGLKVYPNQGFYPWEEKVYSFFEICTERGLPVFTCTTPNSFPHRVRFGNPVHLADVQVDFPDMPLIMGHAGHPTYFEQALGVAGGALNTYLEFCGANWSSELASDEEGLVKTLDRARNRIGAERMMFGSDLQSGTRWHAETSMYGFDLKRWVDWWADLPTNASKYGVTFTQAETDLIMGDNAARILGLKPDPALTVPKVGLGPRRPRPTPER